MVVIRLLISVSAFQLIGYQRSYSTYAPTTGGTFAEGVVGPLETMNPIFARTTAEQSASRLIFSGLLSYDSTTHLRGELADSWRAEDEGRRYIVDLKKDVYWHDGKKVTADDVVYTINMIKNPLVRSPLYSSWSQVKVEHSGYYQSIYWDPLRRSVYANQILTDSLLGRALSCLTDYR